MLSPLAAAIALSGAPAPTEVMILGTYHMANPGLDVVKTAIRDTMGSDRQREIEDLVRRLQRFRPTKIVVEVPVESQEALNRRYQAHRDGSINLSASETEQVGFRLAKALGHPRLYAADYRNSFDFGALMSMAQKQGMKEWLEQTQSAIARIGDASQRIDARYTVGEILGIMNQERAVQWSHSMYVEMIPVHDGKAFPGVNLVSEWYRRNLQIWANIRRVTEPGDRVLVLYGAGHAKYLRDFVKESPGFSFVDPTRYLPKPRITMEQIWEETAKPDRPKK